MESTDFERFVTARAPSLVRLAYLLSGSLETAEDLVQEALLKAHRRWDRVARTDRPEAYVRRMVINEHLSWRRRRSSLESPTARDTETAIPGIEEALVERDRVWHLLTVLPVRQRAVLVLRYYESLSDAEIAELIGSAEGTVRSLAARAFSTLRVEPERVDDVGEVRTRFWDARSAEEGKA